MPPYRSGSNAGHSGDLANRVETFLVIALYQAGHGHPMMRKREFRNSLRAVLGFDLYRIATATGAEMLPLLFFDPFFERIKQRRLYIDNFC